MTDFVLKKGKAIIISYKFYRYTKDQWYNELSKNAWNSPVYCINSLQHASVSSCILYKTHKDISQSSTATIPLTSKLSYRARQKHRHKNTSTVNNYSTQPCTKTSSVFWQQLETLVLCSVLARCSMLTRHATTRGSGVLKLYFYRHRRRQPYSWGSTCCPIICAGPAPNVKCCPRFAITVSHARNLVN